MINRRVSVVLCAFVLSVGGAICQVSTASLTGLVKDSSDAVISGAKVTARNTATGIERTGETNSTGYYFFANLPVGTCEISVEKTGFQKVISTVGLDAAEKGRQDFTLTVGAVST